MDILTTPKTFKQSSPALKNRQIVYSLILGGLALFAVMWFSVAVKGLFYTWDAPINDWFMQLRQNAPAWATNVARWTGKAGSQGITAVTILLLTIWAFRRQFRYFWLMFASVVGVEFLWLAVVFGIGRPRPVEVRTVGDILLPGFPSGHVMIFIAFFGVLLYLFFMQVKNRGQRWAIVALVLALFFITGFIRLYFNAHYFTDVLAGYGLGFAWTAFAVTAVDIIYLRRQET